MDGLRELDGFVTELDEPVTELDDSVTELDDPLQQIVLAHYHLAFNDQELHSLVTELAFVPSALHDG